MKNKSSVTSIVVIVMLLVLFGALLWSGYERMNWRVGPRGIDNNRQKAAEQKLQTKDYINQKYNYSVKYPEDLYQISNTGAPDTDTYFCSDKKATSPMEMGNRVWVTIRYDNNKENLPLHAWVKKYATPSESFELTGNIILDNESTILIRDENFNNLEGTEGGYSRVAYMYRPTDRAILILRFLATSQKNFDRYAEDFDVMYSSFRMQL